MNINIENKVIGPEDLVKFNHGKVASAKLLDVSKSQLEANMGMPLSDKISRNTAGKEFSTLIKASGPYHSGTEAYAKVWNMLEHKIKKLKQKTGGKRQNLISYPEDYQDLILTAQIDLTRRAMEEPDFTGIFTDEQQRPDAPNPVPIREMLRFAAKFGEYKPEQAPNMVQLKTGGVDSFELTLYDVGHVRDLYSVLFDTQIWKLEKVLDAVTRAYTGLRNTHVIKEVLNDTTFHASQTVAADATGATYDMQLYNTMTTAIETLLGLLDMQTGKDITANRTILFVRDKIIAGRLNRIIQGQLIQTSNNSQQLMPSIPIDQIAYYKGDAWNWMKETVTIEGCPANTAYLFVPGGAGSPWYTLTKAPLTVETGAGVTLTLSQNQRVWWFGDGRYYKEFLGSSGDAGAGEWASGYGYIVKITLPTPST